MAILNYSNLLNQASGDTAGGRALGMMSGLQQYQNNAQNMGIVQAQEQERLSNIESKNQAALMERQKRIEAAELLKSGTPDQIAELGVTHPGIYEDFITAAKFKDESFVSSRLNYAKDVISGAVEPVQAIRSRIKNVVEQGGDASSLIETERNGRDAIIAAAKKDISVLSPELYKSIFGDESKDGKPETTTDITNWRQYQKLKKTSPEDAKAFGQQSGFVTPEGKELSVHLQKRLSDASDLAAKSDANIGKYETLISDIAGANLKGGVFEGSWKESFKDITGNQDFVTDLRRQYAGIRGSQLVDNLPPGAASDKDIELALAGFPTDNATGEQLQSFLRGLVKLEGFKRDLNNFKAEYISEKGNERGMLKEWRKKAKDRVENPNVVEWGDM